MDPWEHTTKAQHNYITQDEREGENLKSSRGKETVTYKGVPIRLSADFSKEALQGLARNIQSDEKQGPTTKITLPSKAIISN